VNWVGRAAKQEREEAADYLPWLAPCVFGRIEGKGYVCAFFVLGEQYFMVIISYSLIFFVEYCVDNWVSLEISKTYRR
jgi:hypothetical protein